MLDEKWDKRFLRLCYEIASWSKDPSTKVGSIIVGDKKKILSVGFNGFPRDIFDKEEYYNDREFKLALICHAERNALDNADVSVDGATLYSTLYPCNECAKSILQKGISRVVYCERFEGKDEMYGWYNTDKLFKETNKIVTRYNKDEL